jgi:multiple sugar transport system permease protein
MKKKTNIVRIITTVVMFAVSIAMLLPLVWMVSASCKVEQDVFAYPIQWIPKQWNAVQNYRTVILENQFFKNYVNSFIQTGGVVVLSLTLGSMCAYAFSKIKFKGSEKLFLGFLALMMIPPQLTLVSRFIIVQKIHLYDTLLVLILMESFSVYGVFLLRQFMISIPDSICESARMDGAGHFTIYSQIMLPMVKPALATLGILKTVWAWNDYQGPMVFLSSSDKFTVQLAVQQFAQADGMTPVYSLVMTGAVIATVPLIIIFIMFQSKVIDGIAVGAVKG